jgi:glycosyltransferase involved in cell wall biosynthesis
MMYIIVPVWNSEQWIGKCINTLKNQSFTEWRCCIVDDFSDDNTTEVISEAVKGDKRFTTIFRTRHTGSSLSGYARGIEELKPQGNDIVCWIDGDDWLYGEDALDIINDIYKNENIWFSYGSWIVEPGGQKLNSSERIIPNFVHEQGSYRDFQHVGTHFRTHRAFLWWNIKMEDLIDPRKDEFWTEANDTAYIFPMLEMCGSAERIHLNPHVVYVLNRGHQFHEHLVKPMEQKQTEQIIRAKTRYAKL